MSHGKRDGLNFLGLPLLGAKSGSNRSRGTVPIFAAERGFLVVTLFRRENGTVPFGR